MFSCEEINEIMYPTVVVRILKDPKHQMRLEFLLGRERVVF